MKIIPDIKATFGDTYFLGFTEKKKFDPTTNKRTEENESYVCRLASSELQGQIEVTVPLSTTVDQLKFNEKVLMQNVVIDPYARNSGGSFAQVILRCTAKAIIPDASAKSAIDRSIGQK